MSLTGQGEAERLRAEYITSDFFSLLGVKPVVGRTLTEGEDRIGAAPLVLVSEGFWQRKLGSSTPAARNISSISFAPFLAADAMSVST